VETEERPLSELPKWERLGRPVRAHASTEKTRSPADEALLDCICSEGWMHFVRIVIEKAKPLHRSLVVGAFGTGAEAEARIGALKILAEILGTAYGRAGLDFPEYLRMLLTGDIT
jgi:hypothetical protein